MLFVLQTASPMIWSWMSDMLPRDAEQRSMIIGVCIAFYYATSEHLLTQSSASLRSSRQTHGPTRSSTPPLKPRTTSKAGLRCSASSS